MSKLSILVDAPDIRFVDGKLIINADWGDAEDLQMHLHRQGIPAIRYWDPTNLEARLEVTPGTDEQFVREALDDWLSRCGHPA